MATMRAAVISKPKGPIEIVERPIPEPTVGTVRVKVEACGVCHSDSVVKDGLFAGIPYPRIPGHEVSGVIDKLGPEVKGWKVGDHVGVGWNGGYCGYCEPCRRGQFFACVNGMTTGISFDGGYAEYMIAPASALALFPAGMAGLDAAPLMCAGITTFNALRNCGARPGDLVAVFGLGGLGHLGVQYAAKMGFYTVAIARGQDKKALATKLGADLFIDSQATDAAAELLKLGGAKAILATVTEGKAMSQIAAGLGVEGTLMAIGVTNSMEISPVRMLTSSQAVKGWYSGTSIDTQDTLAFSARTGVASMNEHYPLSRAAEAYDRMFSGKARFRVVLKMGE
ncbi:MAG TPA: alcohol dehydrogenase [Pirellulales bacterium]|nr:alcohol dehydrogenase [Pirellulales bacterium]